MQLPVPSAAGRRPGPPGTSPGSAPSRS